MRASAMRLVVRDALARAKNARRRRRRAPVRPLAGRRGRDVRALRGAGARGVQRAPADHGRCGRRAARARPVARPTRPVHAGRRLARPTARRTPNQQRHLGEPLGDLGPVLGRPHRRHSRPAPRTLARPRTSPRSHRRCGPEEHAVHNTSQPFLDHSMYFQNTIQVVEPTARHLLGPDFPTPPAAVAYIENLPRVIDKKSLGINMLAAVVIAALAARPARRLRGVRVARERGGMARSGGSSACSPDGHAIEEAVRGGAEPRSRSSPIRRASDPGAGSSPRRCIAAPSSG